MCCLNNEELAYEELNAKLPNVGDFVTTSDGTAGEVSSVNVLKQIVRGVITDEYGDKEARDYKVEDLAFKPRRHKERRSNVDSAEEKELKELERLEKKEGGSHIDD